MFEPDHDDEPAPREPIFSMRQQRLELIQYRDQMSQQKFWLTEQLQRFRRLLEEQQQLLARTQSMLDPLKAQQERLMVQTARARDARYLRVVDCSPDNEPPQRLLPPGLD